MGTLRRMRGGGDVASMMRGAVGAMFTKAVGAASGLGLAVLVARYLGVDQTGVYYTALQLVMVAAFVGRLGLDQQLMRVVAGGMTGGLGGVHTLRRMLRAAVVSTSVVGLIMLFSAGWLARYFAQPDLKWLLPYWVLAALATVVFMLSSQIVRGTHRIWESSFYLFASVNLIAVSLVGLVALLGPKSLSRMKVVALAYLTATVVTALVSFFRARIVVNAASATVQETVASSAAVRYRTLLKSSGAFMIYGLGTAGSGWVASLVLARFQDSAQVAVYNSAFRVSMLVSFVLTAVVSVVGPRFAQFYQSGEYDRLTRLYGMATWLTVAIALPTTVLLWLDGARVMGLFGQGFTAGVPVLAILLAGQLVNALVGPTGALLIAAHEERALRNITAIGLIVGVALQLLLVPIMGATGAALATALIAIITNGIAIILVWKLLVSSKANRSGTMQIMKWWTR